MATTDASDSRWFVDTNIVATMLTYGFSTLLTHNTADFVRFASLIRIMPLTP